LDSKPRGYLSIKRRPGQYINIGNQISIFISGVQEQTVKIGIKAPGFQIFRGLEEPTLEVGLLVQGKTAPGADK
jgi:hypothetical protein